MQGLDRFEARKLIIATFEDLGLLAQLKRQRTPSRMATGQVSRWNPG